MVVVFVVGLVMQFAGMLVALVGLDDLVRALFPDSRLPIIGDARNGLRWLGKWCRSAWRYVVRIFQRHPQTHVTGGAAGGFGVVGSARGRVGTAPFRLPRREVDRWPWVLSTLEQLRVQVDTNRNDIKDEVESVRTKLHDDLTTVRSEIEPAAERAAQGLVVKVYGDTGRGIKLAAVGLVLTVAGSIVAALAALYI